MEKLIIDRSKWRTGGNETANMTGKGTTLLLNDEGFMCCLGFESIRLGATLEQIEGLACPDKLNFPLLNLTRPNEMYEPELTDPIDTPEFIDTGFTIAAMQLNDDEGLTSEEREESIKAHFLKIDVEVEFIGEYVKP